MFKSKAKYRRQVKEGLTRAFGGAEEVSFDAATEKLIVFSDLHKGSRDGADDFRICERAYHAALGYYLEQGHTLYALGDVEELWECNPEEVLEAYPDSLKLEAEFHKRGRYRRFWGNHDDIWGRPDQVAKHLSYFYGDDLKAQEAIRLNVTGGSTTGTLFFVHGHQGTLFSDRHRTIGRFFVHHFWRPIQRLTKRSLNTPAKDAELRGAHDTAMYEWANGHGDNPVLIAGHTHRPVFWNDWQSKLAAEKQALDELRDATPPPSPQQLAEARAAYEHRRTLLRWPGPPPRALESPCYFNTGCCAFGDGDVTGIEIADGEIRLVRWLDDSEQPLPEILARAPLGTVLERVASAGAAG